MSRNNKANMTCPKCGLEILAAQNFCRSCGTRVQMTTQRLVTPQVVTDLEGTSNTGTKGHDIPNHFALWGFIVMFLGVAIGVVGKLLLHADIVTVVGVLLSLIGMFLIVYPYLTPARRKKGDSSVSSLLEELTPPQRTGYLPDASNTEFVPSITEKTTDLLESSARKPEQTEDKKLET